MLLPGRLPAELLKYFYLKRYRKRKAACIIDKTGNQTNIGPDRNYSISLK